MTERFGKTKYATIRRDINRLRKAIRSHDSFATEEAWEKCERWIEALPLPAPAHDNGVDADAH